MVLIPFYISRRSTLKCSQMCCLYLYLLHRDVIWHAQVRSCCSFVCSSDVALKLVQYIVLLAQNKEHHIILGMLLSSQVSVKISTQLSVLHERILSRISSSLMAGDLALARKKLSRAGLCGLACSLAHILLSLPRFCLRCLHGHGQQMVRASAACCSLE